MKKLLLSLSLLVSMSSFAAMEMNFCVEVQNSCHRAEVMGCEGGYIKYELQNKKYFRITPSLEKAAAYVACLKEAKLEEGLTCRSIENTCHIAERMGCEGGYSLESIDVNNSTFVPRSLATDNTANSATSGCVNI